MKLTQLTTKPQLIKIVLDDEETVNQYGDAIEFYIYDKQPIDTFVRLATAKADDMSNIVQMVNSLVLDEKGEQILKNDLTVPSDILLKVINKVTETLGK